MRREPASDAAGLAAELTYLWGDTLQAKCWSERLHLLNDIHDQLRSDVGDLELYCAVSPLFVAGLIEWLGCGDITCVEQAHIYSNSADEAHRQAAGRWLEAYHRSVRVD